MYYSYSIVSYEGSDVSHHGNPTATTTTMAAGRNGPLEPHKRPCVLRRRVGLIGNNPPSKRICFLWGVVGLSLIHI